MNLDIEWFKEYLIEAHGDEDSEDQQIIIEACWKLIARVEQLEAEKPCRCQHQGEENPTTPATAAIMQIESANGT